MIIRPIEKNDVRDIVKFKKRSIPMCANGFYSKEIIKHWAMAASIKRLLESIKKGRVGFVAEENGKVIGECSLDKDGQYIKTLMSMLITKVNK